MTKILRRISDAHSIYAIRYQLTESLAIVRKSTGVNLGKIGRCFQKTQAFTAGVVRACSFLEDFYEEKYSWLHCWNCPELSNALI